MEYMNYINENALILIPALYIIGLFLKQSKVKDKYIPLIILACGVIGSVCLLGISITAIISGILAAGTAVFSNQLYKQLTEK